MACQAVDLNLVGLLVQIFGDFFLQSMEVTCYLADSSQVKIAAALIVYVDG